MNVNNSYASSSTPYIPPPNEDKKEDIIVHKKDGRGPGYYERIDPNYPPNDYEDRELVIPEHKECPDDCIIS